MLQACDHSRAALRRLLRQRRRALGRAAQRRAARNLYRQIAQHPLLRRARSLALYLPADGEIDPGLIREACWRRGIAVYLPLLADWPRTHMSFQRIRRGERLYPNRFGIAEPRRNRAQQRKAWTLSLLLLPLVGFDARGGRLGMGGGFYDRALAWRVRRPNCQRPQLIGLAHACQQVDALPLEPWDVPLTGVFTDQQFFPVSGGQP